MTKVLGKVSPITIPLRKRRSQKPDGKCEETKLIVNFKKYCKGCEYGLILVKTKLDGDHFDVFVTFNY